MSDQDIARVVFMRGGIVEEISLIAPAEADAWCALRGFDAWCVQPVALDAPARMLQAGDMVAAPLTPDPDLAIDPDRLTIERDGLTIARNGAVDVAALRTAHDRARTGAKS